MCEDSVSFNHIYSKVDNCLQTGIGVGTSNMTQNGTRKNQIEEAIEVAAEAHQGQYRKGTRTPYITHPYAVGLILMKAGCSEAVIVAGILHDTVEDTDLTLGFIEEHFGAYIADIVDGCSENKALRWRARKTERIEALRIASPEVCTVTCADKLHNLRTIISEYDVIGDAVWERFHGGVEDQAWYYRSVLEAISEDTVNSQLFQQFQQAVDYLFEGEI